MSVPHRLSKCSLFSFLGILLIPDLIFAIRVVLEKPASALAILRVQFS